jgi:cyclophilin family peptidyl-prolyl cis-trans isomerase
LVRLPRLAIENQKPGDDSIGASGRGFSERVTLRFIALVLFAWVAIATAPRCAGAQAPPAQKKDETSQSLADVRLGSREELVAVIQAKRDNEDLGEIHIRLHHKYAPRHVQNFVRLAEKKFYDGTLFHRVKKESFVQGGDPLSKDANPDNDGTGGPGYMLQPEHNDKKHIRGAVAMAAIGKKNAGSQFFIDLKDHSGWDGKYTVFGNVIQGIEVADEIGNGKLEGERPVTPVRMTVHVEKRKRALKL